MSEVPPGYRALTRPDELRAIAHPLRRGIIEALRGEVLSATSLAGRLHEPVARVHHHLQVLLRAGLVERAGDVRHGRARERLYQALDEHWWVPHSIFGDRTAEAHVAWGQLDDRVREAAAGFEAALARSRREGPDPAETWQEIDVKLPAALAPYVPALLAGWLRTLEGLGRSDGASYHVVAAVHRQPPHADGGPTGGAS